MTATRTTMSSIQYKDVVMQAKQALESGKTMVVFDLETTGLSKNKDRILSFSAIKLVMQEGKLKETGKMDLFINPGFPIPPEATAVNHITDEDVKDCPDEEEAAIKIRRFLGNNPFMAGYNSTSFDEQFVNAMYLRVFGDEFKPSLHLDVFKMAKEQMPELKNHKLTTISHELGCDVGLTAHTSMDDVIATKRVMELLLDKYEEVPSAPGGRRLQIVGVRYWQGPNHRLKRIYVETRNGKQKTFYDLYKGVWQSEVEDANLEMLRSDVLAQFGVQDEKELGKILAANA